MRAPIVCMLACAAALALGGCSGGNGSGGDGTGDASTGSDGATSGDAGDAGDSGAGDGSGGTGGGTTSTTGGPPECAVHADCRIDCQTCLPVPGDPGPCEQPCPGVPGCFEGQCSFLADCDQEHALCGKPVPECEPGEVPVVNDGCWVGCIAEGLCYEHDGSTKDPGDECQAYGPEECGPGLMCWDIDPGTRVGTCVEACGEPDYECSDAAQTCVVANDGAVSLCVPMCDPLAQNCPGDQGCYFVNGELVCAPSGAGPTDGGYGDPCGYANGCDPGLMCVNASRVPGCMEPMCCSPYCDVDQPSCPDEAMGQGCEPIFLPGTAPEGAENVGVCSL